MKKFFWKLKYLGIIGVLVKIVKIIFYNIFHVLEQMEWRICAFRFKFFRSIKLKKLEKKINNPKYKNVYVFYPYTEWDLPIFQRPQQIALELAKDSKNLYFFCSTNCVYDSFDIYEKINNNLYITNEYEFLMNVKTKKRILHLYSTDTISKYSEIEKALKNGDRVLYEYIDEIHEEITRSLPKDYLTKHKKALRNEKCYVIATAEKLLNDVKKVRKKNYALATNGVNVNDFYGRKVNMPSVIFELKQKYKAIITYYGALAVWFDYDLLKKAATTYPEYAFVLIGMEYDNSFKKSKVTKLKNVFYLGKINYNELINYSKNSDVLTIPFLINEITESTSPVKLFEYMATQVPILTTNMNECRKYESVNIGKTHEEYIKKIPEVIELKNNKKYLDLELKEANNNTWRKKVDVIEKLIK